LPACIAHARPIALPDWPRAVAHGLAGLASRSGLRLRGGGSNAGHGGVVRGSGNMAVWSTVSSAWGRGAEPSLGRAKAAAATLTSGARQRWHGDEGGRRQGRSHRWRPMRKMERVRAVVAGRRVRDVLAGGGTAGQRGGTLGLARSAPDTGLWTRGGQNGAPLRHTCHPRQPIQVA
jgi:hypothetical protein